MVYLTMVAMVGAAYGFSRCLYNSFLFDGADNWKSRVLAGMTAGGAVGVFFRPSPNFASVAGYAAIGTSLLLAWEASDHSLAGPLAKLRPDQQRDFRRDMWKRPPPATIGTEQEES